MMNANTSVLPKALAMAGMLLISGLALQSQEPVTGDPESEASASEETNATSTPALTPMVPGNFDALDAGMQSLTPETVAPSGNFSLGQATQAAAPDESGESQEKIQLWRIVPVFGVISLYDDNIFISNTNRVGDVVFAVSAGLSFELGDFRNLEEDYLIVSYVGTGLIYLNNSAENSYNQFALLDAQYRISNLAIQVKSQYEYLSTPERDVGGLVRRSIFDNSLGFVYSYSDKTSFDLELRQKANIYVDNLDSYDYAIKAGGEYLITEKVALGAEGVVGVLDAEDSPMQYYQQLRVRANYTATGKLTFKISAGVETRQLDAGSNLRVNPVFSLGGEYHPFENTTIALTGYRRIQPSALDRSQDFTATGLELVISQKFFQKFEAELAVGYENDVYFSTDDANGVNRVDNFLFARPSISLTFLTNYRASIFYEYRNNDSNESSFSFYNNRFGLAIEAQF